MDKSAAGADDPKCASVVAAQSTSSVEEFNGVGVALNQ